MVRVEQLADSWSVEMRRGHAKLAVLMFLSRRPMTGYSIMKEIEEKTLGFWRLTAGGVYPILKELEGRGYIKGEWRSEDGRRKKVYEITDEGRRLLEKALQKQQQISETIGSLFREFAREILETEPPPTPTHGFFDFLSGRGLEGKPVNEQIRVLQLIRAHMLEAIKTIDQRLERLKVLNKQ